jgi:hypothetical protein
METPRSADFVRRNSQYVTYLLTYLRSWALLEELSIVQPLRNASMSLISWNYEEISDNTQKENCCFLVGLWACLKCRYRAPGSDIEFFLHVIGGGLVGVSAPWGALSHVKCGLLFHDILQFIEPEPSPRDWRTWDNCHKNQLSLLPVLLSANMETPSWINYCN